jgi:hypothetical protein
MPIRRPRIVFCRCAVIALPLCLLTVSGAQTQKATTPTATPQQAQEPQAQTSKSQAQQAQAPQAQTPKTPSAQQQVPQEPKPDWETYNYPTDGFSTSFPSAPAHSTKNVDTATGTYELHSYLAVEGRTALYVGVCDYGSRPSTDNPNTLLEGAKDGALKNSNAHLLSEQNITLGIYNGLEYEAESDTVHFTARLYMVGAILYQTIVVTPRSQPYTDTVRFLNSFQLIARPVD